MAPVLAADTRPPAWLEAAARREWSRLVPILARAGVSIELDADLVTVYACTVADWRFAHAQILRHRRIGAKQPSPYVPVAHRQLILVRQLLADFGMAPVARARVTRAAPPTPPSPLDKFLRPSNVHPPQAE